MSPRRFCFMRKGIWCKYRDEIELVARKANMRIAIAFVQRSHCSDWFMGLTPQTNSSPGSWLARKQLNAANVINEMVESKSAWEILHKFKTVLLVRNSDTVFSDTVIIG